MKNLKTYISEKLIINKDYKESDDSVFRLIEIFQKYDTKEIHYNDSWGFSFNLTDVINYEKFLSICEDLKKYNEKITKEEANEKLDYGRAIMNMNGDTIWFYVKPQRKTASHKTILIIQITRIDFLDEIIVSARFDSNMVETDTYYIIDMFAIKELFRYIVEHNNNSGQTPGTGSYNLIMQQLIGRR